MKARRTYHRAGRVAETLVPIRARGPQVGLSGSSALVVAALRGLCRFYGLDPSADLGVPLERLPQVCQD